MNKEFESFPTEDKSWEEAHWKGLLEYLLSEKMVSYKEIASLVLGHLNPSQVGTSIASNKSFQTQFPKGKIWENVRDWSYQQTGRCADCGTRLELQGDHIISREALGAEADRLDNMTYRCRRCNVIKRPSHKQGGLTFLTTEAALMWILMTRKPTTYQEFAQMCRDYGLTMANIRFQEAWAMAKWLERIGKYEIHPDSKY
jgi:hypothetical protein